MKRLFVLLPLLLVTFSCNIKTDPITAGGAPYSVFMIAENNIAGSTLGDTIRAMFSKPVEWINQEEPIYDLSILTPQTISPVIKQSRNLIFVDVNSKYDSTELQMTNDEFVPDQVCFHITSPSIPQATDYLWKYHNLIVGVLDKVERDRFIKRLKVFESKSLHSQVKDSFDFDLCIPNDYKLRNAKKDFIWISKEMPESSQGVIVYRFNELPSDSTWIVAMRNRAVGQIPGPSKGSKMSTYTEFFPETHVVTINGRLWWETKGFWNVEGDFMGGPFVNYVTEYKDSFIGIDLYVYSPSYRYPQRNYIRQLEAIPLTASFK